MRYGVLVLLNAPIIFLALVNIVSQYKLGRVSQTRFRHQIILWLLIMAVLIGSFPFYNLANGKPALESANLSLFDIVQTTAIIYLIYIINNFRRKIEQNEHTIRNLHQELSITLSAKDGKD
jgi:hypothetical protein